MITTFLGIQIISVSFAFFMIYITSLHFKRRIIGKTEYLFWLTVWITFISFALFPRILDPILASLFVARAMDLLMIGAFIILSYLGYQNHIGIKELQKNITRMVSADAKKKAKKA